MKFVILYFWPISKRSYPSLINVFLNYIKIELKERISLIDSIDVIQQWNSLNMNPITSC